MQTKQETTAFISSVQTSLFTPTSCVFTGHRELDEDFKKRKLKKLIECAILDGVKDFYCGMACGFDLIAGETVLALKRKYKGVKLIACIPCLNQERTFPAEDKKRYVKLLKKVDESILISNEAYFVGCMHKRNRFMCDKADMMIAYCKKEKGGTAYTVNYFHKTYPKKPVIFL